MLVGGRARINYRDVTCWINHDRARQLAPRVGRVKGLGVSGHDSLKYWP